MAILTRSELIEKFKNDSIPTQNDFKDMIDSLLNRKDDCFFGKWESNRKYRDGSVVLYGKSLYRLILPQQEEDCPEDESVEIIDDEVGEGENEFNDNLPQMVKADGSPSSDDEAPTDGHSTDIPTICSNQPPTKDQRWCMLEFQVEDDDWEVKEIDGQCVLTPKKGDALIGIGTDEDLPQGLIEVRSPETGNVIISPSDAIHPTIVLQNKEDQTGTIQLSSERLENHSEAPLGFAFFKKSETTQETEEGSETRTMNSLLMTMDTSAEGHSRVGIGTYHPKASLDAKLEGKGQILIQPGEKTDPEIVLLNLDPACYENYLTTSVGKNHATFTTDAEGGFQFKKGEEYRLYQTREKTKKEEADLPPELENNTLMTITTEGKVGVGTETPVAHVEVKHDTKGSFQMSFEKTNPVFCIANNRPSASNSFSVGTDNNFGILMTDSEKGFVFKKSESGQKNNGTPDINYGSDLMKLTPDHKLGIGIDPDYHLDVAGKTRTNGVYIETDVKKMNVISTYEDALKKESQSAIGKICQLEPVVFKWNERTNCAEDGLHLGLLAHEVADLFPETVRTHSDATQAVAYGNLVAGLVQAIKEQQNQITSLTERIQKLELNKY